MAPESTSGLPATNEQENKYLRVLSLAQQRKRTRANLDDDYRRPHYEPARPPASEDGAST